MSRNITSLFNLGIILARNYIFVYLSDPHMPRCLTATHPKVQGRTALHVQLQFEKKKREDNNKTKHLNDHKIRIA